MSKKSNTSSTKNTTDTKKRKREPKPTIFKTIAELNHDTTDSFYGFIINTYPPKKSTNDEIVKIVVADSPDHKVNVLLFYSEYNSIIEYLKVGSIIRLERARITKEYGAITATGNLTRSISYFNIVVVPGVEGDPIERFGSFRKYKFDEKDTEKVKELRILWREIKHIFIKTYDVDNVINRTALADIEHKEKVVVNVVGKIIASSFTTNSMNKRLTLHIWDGTGEHFEIIDDEPRFGSLFSVIAWNPDKIPVLDSIGEGMWVLFKKLVTNIYNSNLELKVQSNSDVIPLASNDSIVLNILMYHQSRLDEYDKLLNINHKNDVDNGENNNNNDNDNGNISMTTATIPPQLYLTETDYPSKPITKISDITSIDSKVPNKYKICARLVQHIPMNITNFSRPICRECNTFFPYHIYIDSFQKCPNCQSENRIEYIYVLKLLLEDDTDSIPVILYDKHATNFFQVLPSNLEEDKTTLYKLERSIERLKGKEFICCIMSYYMEDKEESPENIRYQIFDTRIKQ